MYRFVQMANMALMSASEEGAEEVYGPGTMALYSIIGFLLVIAVLIILIVLLVVFSKILNGIKLKRKKADVAATGTVEEVSPEEDSETVAAITAALMAYYETNAKPEEKADVMPVPFVIRSIKKL